ncbi:hypothetical protein [Porphyrobacter sp. AAP82]|uniref:hypothetical protein n=1 Tax=Porphyrobacter sp. AAP82 TaxID=1248917 RepID=UPI00031CA817|nr:hypothetical protein [Porphyrobacter sp. AAP82]
MSFFRTLAIAGAVAGGLVAGTCGALAQDPAGGAPAPVATAPAGPTYADLAALSDAAELVLRVQIRKATALKPERAQRVAPGFARLYVEANTLALIAGRSGVGAGVTYLVDVPLDARGKVPKLKKREFLLFARGVPGRPGELQLIAPGAQIDYAPALEARVRPILTELYAKDAAPRITGISDALAVPGTLTGESETQIFLATENRSPVSITVLRRPGQRPQWGVSWGEIIDSAAQPPAPETLRWYRLACALPAQLPSNANLSREAAERRLAAGDYAFVRQALGPCERRITQGG